MGLGKMLFSPTGRIRRRDYWVYSIAITVVYLVIYLGVGFGTGEYALLVENEYAPTPILKTTEIILNIAMIWPSVCLQIKRWHDRDKGAMWILINIIPIIGWIWALVELGFLDGTPGKNSYGHSPKGLGKEKIVSAFD